MARPINGLRNADVGKTTVNVEHREVGVCGLSCRLCPAYYTKGESRCRGCKSAFRMAVGCPFITCALKRKGIEFCWECAESEACDRWSVHREASREHDTFVCYQKLESNIAFIRGRGIGAFERDQRTRGKLLKRMLDGYNEGRSKRYYSIAATVMKVPELEAALARAAPIARAQDLKAKSRALHAELDRIAAAKGYRLKLRK